MIEIIKLARNRSHSVVCLLGFFFVLFKVKETKGKTLEEMEGLMRGH